VEGHLVESAHKQESNYDQKATPRSFKAGDPVWLSSPRAGKLDPKWEGEWEIQTVNGPTTYTIFNGKQAKTVHINRLRPRVLPAQKTVEPDSPMAVKWTPPSTEHEIIDAAPLSHS